MARECCLFGRYAYRFPQVGGYDMIGPSRNISKSQTFVWVWHTEEIFIFQIRLFVYNLIVFNAFWFLLGTL